jgi:hypothetical protein
MEVPVCECRLAAVSLVRGGAFPCAPLQPSLAVDLRVLEFAFKLFLNVAPNHTAFSTTLETVLSTMGYQLNRQVFTFSKKYFSFHWTKPTVEHTLPTIR